MLRGIGSPNAEEIIGKACRPRVAAWLRPARAV